VGNIFFEITVIICVAAVLTILFRLLKQPAILAYILTGILLGPLGLIHFDNHESLRTLGQVGITLLLFMLGMELKLKELHSIGKTAIIAGLLQLWFTFFAGFFISWGLLHFSQISSMYIGLALAFSSTIIVVKMLSDKKDTTSLHGKLAIGILLVQDFFALLAMVFISGSGSATGLSMITHFAGLLIKIGVLFFVIYLLSTTVFPRITRFLARSPESLFLFSLAWVFALTALVASPFIGFSIEIGGFLAGLALANSNEHFQIIAKMKALRDFFITIFFVLLGLEMTLGQVSKVLLPAIVIVLFVLAIKPLIITGVLGLLGYRKRTSFLVGISLGQVSEFSFILLFLGQRLGHIPSSMVSLVILVGLISFLCSTYTLQNSTPLYRKLEKYLQFFEGKDAHKEPRTLHTISMEDMKNHVVVVGGHHMGESIVRALTESGEKVIVVDFNPDVVARLDKNGVTSFFGDIADNEIQERVGINHAKLVISTVPDMEDNLLLIQGMNSFNKRAKIIVMAYDGNDAKTLYKAGADYVILPELAGGRHLAKILLDKNHLELIESYKEKDLAFIK